MKENSFADLAPPVPAGGAYSTSTDPSWILGEGVGERDWKEESGRRGAEAGKKWKGKEKGGK